MIKIDCKKRLSENFEIDAKLTVARGSFACMYGASGSGKTTLLRVLAGFYKIDSGVIKVGERVMDDGRNFTHARGRKIGFLFQDYALFENMNVIKNLLFAKNNRAKADEILDFLELGSHANDSVVALSGGQKQRVALARALMQEPEILLLDEPLSALDAKIREKIQDYLKKIHEKFDTTIVLVSHDVSEIYKLCDTVFEMRDGRVVRTATPAEIFLKTSGSQKFAFVGKIVNLQKKDGAYLAVVAIGQQLSEIVLSASEACDLRVGDTVRVGAKAFNINLAKISQNGEKNDD